MPETQSSDGTDMTEISQLRQTILEHLISTTGKDRSAASSRDWYIATALVVRDRIIQSPGSPSKKSAYDNSSGRVYYLSLEFLIGRLLMDALDRLGLTAQIRAALAGLGVDLDELSEGRARRRAWQPAASAAWRLLHGKHGDAFALAAFGYGIRYDLGLFRQAHQGRLAAGISRGLAPFGNPWEFRPAAN